MRVFYTIIQDIRFQFKYGFYFIYAIMILFYLVVISLLPDSWKSMVTAVVIFADPAALGFFFIGGILLMERGERVLDAIFVSPLGVWEYILSKAASLGIISVIVGCLLAFFGLGEKVNYPVLAVSLLAGSAFYTFSGIIAGIRAKSVNQYMVITVPAEILLSLPPALLLSGVNSIFLEIMPTSLALRLIQWSLGIYSATGPLPMFAGLLLWCIPAFLLATGRMKWFLSRIGGEVYETDN